MGKKTSIGWKVISLFMLSGLAVLVVQGILSCNSQMAVHDEQIKTLKEATGGLRSDLTSGFKGVNERLDRVLLDRTIRTASRQPYGPPVQ